MNHENCLQVPFQLTNPVILPTRRERKLDRAIKSSIVAFIIAVALVSFVSNKFNDYEKQLRASATTCHANSQPLPHGEKK